MRIYFLLKSGFVVVMYWFTLPIYVRAHDDVIAWKHFPHYWSFLRGNHRSPVVPSQSQWRGALMFSLICSWTNGWANNRDDRSFRCHCTHYDVTVMLFYWINYCHSAWKEALTNMSKTSQESIVNTLKPGHNGLHFPKRHFQMHFLKWKYMNFDWDFTEVCS